MMEKGYRIAPCPNCGQKHRLKITAADYGKIVTVKCKNTPTCRTTFRTTIPTPEESHEAASTKDEDFHREVEEAQKEFNGALNVFDALLGKFGGKKK